MNKREFLSGAALPAAATPTVAARSANGQPNGCSAFSPILLTVSSAIDRHNRGPLNPRW
ncbi:MAG TPA: hypothetical protein VL689_14175 [Paraburkholderia sp.]|nr:hypothetical protein [Paraburkholderia sp.]